MAKVYEYEVRWTDLQPDLPCPERHMVSLRIHSTDAWEGAEHTISTDSAVHMLQQGDVIHGYGFAVCECGYGYLVSS